MYGVQYRVSGCSLYRYLSRSKSPRPGPRTVSLAAGGCCRAGARPLLRLQTLRGDLPITGQHPGIHPAGAEPGRPRKRSQPSRLGARTNEIAGKTGQHDGPAGQLRQSQPAVPRADGALRGNPPSAAPAQVPVAYLRAMVQAAPATSHVTTKGGVFLRMLGEVA